MQTVAGNFRLAAGLLFAAVFDYWMNWSARAPILEGDHAVYFLTADQVGIAGGTCARIEIAHAISANKTECSLASVSIRLTIVNNHSEALNGVV